MKELVQMLKENGMTIGSCESLTAGLFTSRMDLCVSFTGNAGPDCMEGKPAGTVYCALAAEGGCETWHFHFAHASRNAVRSRVVDEMVLRIKSYLNEGQGNE